LWLADYDSFDGELVVRPANFGMHRLFHAYIAPIEKRARVDESSTVLEVLGIGAWLPRSTPL
jgi:hypothetical protein